MVRTLWILLSLFGSHLVLGNTTFLFEGQLWDINQKIPIQGERRIRVTLVSGLVNDLVVPTTRTIWGTERFFQFDKGFILIEMGAGGGINPEDLLSPNLGVVISVADMEAPVVVPIRHIPNVAISSISQRASQVDVMGVMGVLSSKQLTGKYPSIRGLGPLNGLEIGGVVIRANQDRMGIGILNPQASLDSEHFIRIRQGELRLADGSILKSAQLNRIAQGVATTQAIVVGGDTQSLGYGLTFRVGQNNKMGVLTTGGVWIGDTPESGDGLMVKGGVLVGQANTATLGTIQFLNETFMGYSAMGWKQLDTQPMSTSWWVQGSAGIRPQSGISRLALGLQSTTLSMQVVGYTRASQWLGGFAGDGSGVTGINFVDLLGLLPVAKGGVGVLPVTANGVMVDAGKLVGATVQDQQVMMGVGGGVRVVPIQITNEMNGGFRGEDWVIQHPTVSLWVLDGGEIARVSVDVSGHIVGGVTLNLETRYITESDMDYLYLNNAGMTIRGGLLAVGGINGTVILDYLGANRVRIGSENSMQKLVVSGGIRVGSGNRMVLGSIQWNPFYDWIEGYGSRGWVRLDSPADERAGWRWRDLTLVASGANRVGIATENPSTPLGVAGNSWWGDTSVLALETPRIQVGHTWINRDQLSSDWQFETLQSPWFLAKGQDPVWQSVQVDNLQLGSKPIGGLSGDLLFKDGITLQQMTLQSLMGTPLLVGPWDIQTTQWILGASVTFDGGVEMGPLLKVPRLWVNQGGNQWVIRDRQVAMNRLGIPYFTGMVVSGDVQVGQTRSNEHRTPQSDWLVAGNLIVGGGIVSRVSGQGGIWVDQSFSLAKSLQTGLLIGAFSTPNPVAKWGLMGDGGGVLDWRSNTGDQLMYMTAEGQLSVGHTQPMAWVDSRSGGDIPALLMSPGFLTNTPQKGAIEFKNGIWFTSDTQRKSILLSDTAESLAEQWATIEIQEPGILSVLLLGDIQWPSTISAPQGMWVDLKGGRLGVNRATPLAPLDIDGGLRVGSGEVIPKSIRYDNGQFKGVLDSGESRQLDNVVDSEPIVYNADKTMASSMVNIGIGVSNPQTEIAVQGTIQAQVFRGDGSGILGINDQQISGQLLLSQGGGMASLNGFVIADQTGLKGSTLNLGQLLGQSLAGFGVAVSVNRGLMIQRPKENQMIIALSQLTQSTKLEMGSFGMVSLLSLDFMGNMINMSESNWGGYYITTQNQYLAKTGTTGLSKGLSLNGTDLIGTLGGDLILSAPAIGIGQPTPSTRLDVNGAIRVKDSANAVSGVIRYGDSGFEGWNGERWVALDIGDNVPLKSAGYFVGDGSALINLSHHYASMPLYKGGLEYVGWPYQEVIITNQNGGLESLGLSKHAIMMGGALKARQSSIRGAFLNWDPDQGLISHMGFQQPSINVVAGYGVRSLYFDSIGRITSASMVTFDNRYYTKLETIGLINPIGDRSIIGQFQFLGPYPITTVGSQPLIIEAGGDGRIGLASLRPTALVSVGDIATPVFQSVMMQMGGELTDNTVNREGIKFKISGYGQNQSVEMIRSKPWGAGHDFVLYNRVLTSRPSGVYTSGEWVVGGATPVLIQGMMSGSYFKGDAAAVTGLLLENVQTVLPLEKGGMSSSLIPKGAVLVGNESTVAPISITLKGHLLIGRTGELPQMGRLDSESSDIRFIFGAGSIQLGLSRSLSTQSDMVFKQLFLDRFLRSTKVSIPNGGLVLPKQVQFGEWSRPLLEDVGVSGSMRVSAVVGLEGVSANRKMTIGQSLTANAVIRIKELGDLTGSPQVLHGVPMIPLSFSGDTNVSGWMNVGGAGRVSADRLILGTDQIETPIRLSGELVVDGGFNLDSLVLNQSINIYNGLWNASLGKGVGIDREPTTTLDVNGVLTIDNQAWIRQVTVNAGAVFGNGLLSIQSNGVGLNRSPATGLVMTGDGIANGMAVLNELLVDNQWSVGGLAWVVTPLGLGIGRVPIKALDVVGSMRSMGELSGYEMVAQHIDSGLLTITRNRVGVGTADPRFVLDVALRTRFNQKGLFGTDPWGVVSTGLGIHQLPENALSLSGQWLVSGNVTLTTLTANELDARGLFVSRYWNDSVGIGTKEPLEALHIVGNANVQSKVSGKGVRVLQWLVNPPQSVLVITSSGVGINRATPTMALVVVGGAAANSVTVQRMVVPDTIKANLGWFKTTELGVGVGITPKEALDVLGSGIIRGDTTTNRLTISERLSILNRDADVWIMVDNETKQVRLGSGEPATLSVSGDVIISGNMFSGNVWSTGNLTGDIDHMLINKDHYLNMVINGDASIERGDIRADMGVGLISVNQEKMGVGILSASHHLHVIGSGWARKIQAGSVTINRTSLVVGTSSMRIQNSPLRIGINQPNLGATTLMDVVGDGVVSNRMIANRLTLSNEAKLGNVVVDESGVQIGASPINGNALVGTDMQVSNLIKVGGGVSINQLDFHVGITEVSWSINRGNGGEALEVSGNMMVSNSFSATQFVGDGQFIHHINTESLTGVEALAEGLSGLFFVNGTIRPGTIFLGDGLGKYKGHTFLAINENGFTVNSSSGAITLGLVQNISPTGLPTFNQISLIATRSVLGLLGSGLDIKLDANRTLYLDIGKLGINRLNPNDQLDVIGSGYYSGSLSINPNSEPMGIVLSSQGSMGIGMMSPVPYALAVNGNMILTRGMEAHSLLVNKELQSTVFWMGEVDGEFRVGINTQSPASALDVDGFGSFRSHRLYANTMRGDTIKTNHLKVKQVPSTVWGFYDQPTPWLSLGGATERQANITIFGVAQFKKEVSIARGALLITPFPEVVGIRLGRSYRVPADVSLAVYGDMLIRNQESPALLNPFGKTPSESIMVDVEPGTVQFFAPTSQYTLSVGGEMVSNTINAIVFGGDGGQLTDLSLNSFDTGFWPIETGGIGPMVPSGKFVGAYNGGIQFSVAKGLQLTQLAAPLSVQFSLIQPIETSSNLQFSQLNLNPITDDVVVLPNLSMNRSGNLRWDVGSLGVGIAIPNDTISVSGDARTSKLDVAGQMMMQNKELVLGTGTFSNMDGVNVVGSMTTRENHKTTIMNICSALQVSQFFRAGVYNTLNASNQNCLTYGTLISINIPSDFFKTATSLSPLHKLGFFVSGNAVVKGALVIPSVMWAIRDDRFYSMSMYRNDLMLTVNDDRSWPSYYGSNQDLLDFQFQGMGNDYFGVRTMRVPVGYRIQASSNSTERIDYIDLETTNITANMGSVSKLTSGEFGMDFNGVSKINRLVADLVQTSTVDIVAQLINQLENLNPDFIGNANIANNQLELNYAVFEKDTIRTYAYQANGVQLYSNEKPGLQSGADSNRLNFVIDPNGISDFVSPYLQRYGINWRTRYGIDFFLLRHVRHVKYTPIWWDARPESLYPDRIQTGDPEYDVFGYQLTEAELASRKSSSTVYPGITSATNPVRLESSAKSDTSTPQFLFVYPYNNASNTTFFIQDNRNHCGFYYSPSFSSSYPTDHFMKQMVGVHLFTYDLKNPQGLNWRTTPYYTGHIGIASESNRWLGIDYGDYSEKAVNTLWDLWSVGTIKDDNLRFFEPTCAWATTNVSLANENPIMFAYPRFFVAGMNSAGPNILSSDRVYSLNIDGDDSGLNQLYGVGSSSEPISYLQSMQVDRELQSGVFATDIPHPNAVKQSQGTRLRHYSVQTPGVGGNLYALQVTCNIVGENQFPLPSYMADINRGNTIIQVSPANALWDEAWATIEGSTLKVFTQSPGQYNILIMDDRADEIWNSLGYEGSVFNANPRTTPTIHWSAISSSVGGEGALDSLSVVCQKGGNQFILPYNTFSGREIVVGDGVNEWGKIEGNVLTVVVKTSGTYGVNIMRDRMETLPNPVQSRYGSEYQVSFPRGIIRIIQ